ncbi:MAG: hypothetical protein K2N05_10815 [Muribaculaceae bacterium]|nr:hypothetical protein [Muribaculaceae bacterium]
MKCLCKSFSLFLLLFLFVSCDMWDTEKYYFSGDEKITVHTGESIAFRVKGTNGNSGLFSMNFGDEDFTVSSIMSNVTSGPQICYLGNVGTLEDINLSAYNLDNLKYRTHADAVNEGGYIIRMKTSSAEWVIKLYINEMKNGRYVISYALYCDKKGYSLICQDGSISDNTGNAGSDDGDYNYGFKDVEDGVIDLRNGDKFNILSFLGVSWDELQIEYNNSMLRVFSFSGKVKSSPEIAYVGEVSSPKEINVNLYKSSSLNFESRCKIVDNGGYIIRMSTWGDGNGILYVVTVQSNVDISTNTARLQYWVYKRIGA